MNLEEKIEISGDMGLIELFETLNDEDFEINDIVKVLEENEDGLV